MVSFALPGDGEGMTDHPSVGLTRGEEPSSDDVRLRMRGVNVDSSGQEHSRVSWDDFRANLDTSEYDNDDVLEVLLSGFCAVGSEAWNNYMANRVGLRVPRSDGFGDYEVKKTVMPRHVPPWEEKRTKRQNSDPKVKYKEYTLAQILTDCYLWEKYEFPRRFINSIATLAVTRPADAAVTVKEYLEKKSEGSDVKFRVLAGTYASGTTAAARDIALLAASVPAPQLGTPAQVIGETLYLNDEDEGVPWSVKGPLKHAVTVAHVHRLAVHGGHHATMHLFGVETARLGIEIIYDGVYVSSSVIGHSRDTQDLRFLRDSGTEQTLSELARRHYEVLKVNVHPLSDAGAHKATAVRLNGGVVVACQHVVEGMSSPMVMGAPLTTKQVMGDDLWAYASKGEARPWVFREPVVGEMACIMFHNGAQVSLSPAFKIHSCDGSVILSHLHDGVVRGMSGGAVVAVSDFALLGIHSGQNLVKLRAVRITRTVYEDLCEFATETRSHGSPRGETGVMELMALRGLSSHVELAVDAMTPVFKGDECVGTAVSAGGRLWSVQAGNVEVQQGMDRVPREFFPRANSLLSVAELPTGPAIEKFRSPQLGETVVILGMDGEGPFKTASLSLTSVGPEKRNFVVAAKEKPDLSVAGSLVMSVNDGAVVGIVVRSTREIFFCVSFPTIVGDVDMQGLSKLFPRVELTSWDASELGAALDVTNVGTLGSMSALGASVMQLSVRKSLSSRGVPVVDWSQEVEQALSVRKLAAVFDELGLGAYVKAEPGDGVVVTPEQAAMVMQALVYVMSDHEVMAEVDTWLWSVGLLGVPPSPRNSLARRPSGFDVLAEDGRLLVPYGE